MIVILNLGYWHVCELVKFFSLKFSEAFIFCRPTSWHLTVCPVNSSAGYGIYVIPPFLRPREISPNLLRAPFDSKRLLTDKKYIYIFVPQSRIYRNNYIVGYQDIGVTIQPWVLRSRQVWPSFCRVTRWRCCARGLQIWSSSPCSISPGSETQGVKMDPGPLPNPAEREWCLMASPCRQSLMAKMTTTMILTLSVSTKQIWFAQYMVPCSTLKESALSHWKNP